jgi:aminocarboxymuconate-semialdehyde decarboxylase
VLLAHGGGALLALRGRLRHGHEAVGAAGAALTESPEASIRRFMFDTVTHDPTVLRDLVREVGADHVLLGSDYPFDMADGHPVETIRRAALEEDDEATVLSGNAERLLAIAVR